MDDTGGVITLVVADLLLALAVGGTTAAAAAGRLRCNGIAGIRTSATMASPAAWVAGHRAALPLALAVAALSVVSAVLAGVLLGTDHGTAAVFVACVPVVGVVLALIPIVITANRAARAA